MNISNEEIRGLLSFFEKSGWEQMRFEGGGVKIAVAKSGSLAHHSATEPLPTSTEPTIATANAAVEPAPANPASSPLAPPPALAPGQVYLCAPHLGVVWRKSKPDAPRFVEEGDQIEEGATVCLIEVMKLFTPLNSNVRGKIVRCLVADGQMVETDTPLFIVQTA